MEPRRDRYLKEFAKFSKKYKLPSLEDIELCLGSETTEFPVLQQLIAAIGNRIYRISLALEALFQPKGMADSLESDYYTKEEKDALFPFYKHLNIMLLEANTILLTEDEAKHAEYFKELFKKYKSEIKPEWKEIVEDKVIRWKKDEEPSEDADNYIR